MSTWSLDVSSLTAAIRAGRVAPEAVIEEVYRRIADHGLRPVWITLQPKEEAMRRLAVAAARRNAGAALPLFGVPFAVKDNMDVAGLPTTAGCPDFAHVADRSAAVVERLEAAGAILIGKTNLDQFATGLVGTRSPYGACASVFDGNYISGGSSSGSAVAVAAGLVSFALGTDTAGSGRVPAAFNNIVGLKPTKGLVSTRGVVPACRSLDCVSVFAGTVADAVTVLAQIEGEDAEDPFSRPKPAASPAVIRQGFRFGVPAGDLEFFGDRDAEALFGSAVERLQSLGGTRLKIDFTPFQEVSRLLYQGPWVAERLAALRRLGFDRWEAMDPTVAAIIRGADAITAVDAFEGVYRLAAATRSAERVWKDMDVLLLPTTGTIYRIDAIAADPVRLNSNLGLYTNFVNLMDLSAVAVPAGFRSDGLPFGVTLIGRAFADRAIAPLADRLHRTLPRAAIGGTGLALPDSTWPAEAGTAAKVQVAVVGAHLTGQPLNGQLTSRGATLLRAARTASGYRLYALAGTVPAKPGLLRDKSAAGNIEVEVWEMDTAQFGGFVAEIPSPLGIGTLTLEDGSEVKGFLCEPHALEGATDITALGGWRPWLSQQSSRQGTS